MSNQPLSRLRGAADQNSWQFAAPQGPIEGRLRVKGGADLLSVAGVKETLVDHPTGKSCHSCHALARMARSNSLRRFGIGVRRG